MKLRPLLLVLLALGLYIGVTPYFCSATSLIYPDPNRACFQLLGTTIVFHPDGSISIYSNGSNLGGFGSKWEPWIDENTRGVQISFPGYYIPFVIDITYMRYFIYE